MNYFTMPGIRPMTTLRMSQQIEDLMERVEKAGFARSEVLGRSRKREMVALRYLLMDEIRHRLPISLVSIGAYFNRDHTTVIHGLSMVNKWHETNDFFFEHAAEIIGSYRLGNKQHT